MRGVFASLIKAVVWLKRKYLLLKVNARVHVLRHAMHPKVYDQLLVVVALALMTTLVGIMLCCC